LDKFMARWIVFAGITALLVNGYFATLYERGRSFWRSAQVIPAELQVAAAGALKRSGAGEWATVRVEGQVATLGGIAPTEADREDAKLTVKTAAGAGGTWWGGITLVRDETTLAPLKKPYQWSARRGADRRIMLTGYVPGRRFQMQIRAEAQKLFPTGVDDQTTIAGGQPTGYWSETAIWALNQLAVLQSGDAHFVDSVISLRGQAPNAKVQAAVFDAAKSPPKPYQAIADITLSNSAVLPDAPDETAVFPATLSPVQRLAAADCQKLIDQAMTNNTIEFPAGSAGIEAGHHAVLDRMAQTASDCGTLRFRITGHSDGIGIEAEKPRLSQDRAEAAAKYLTGKGVARERMFTVGAGSSQPAADAATPEGQARNRRIEITVLP
jgi:outer membrane protein OmpA-like peptidoglycan-associated protein